MWNCETNDLELKDPVLGALKWDTMWDGRAGVPRFGKGAAGGRDGRRAGRHRHAADR